eukprot:scaffold495910_cov19-Prasinocladus_malaysianus.AAC.1
MANALQLRFLLVRRRSGLFELTIESHRVRSELKPSTARSIGHETDSCNKTSSARVAYRTKTRMSRTAAHYDTTWPI